MSAAEILYTNPTLESLPNDRCRSAFQFWLDARGEAELPSPAAIDPSRLPPAILPNISVYGVEDGEKRFRFRLVGRAIVQGIGLDPTGTYFEDAPGSGPLIARFSECIESRRPYFYRGPLFWKNNEIATYRSLVMPFAEPGGPVTRLMTYSEYDWIYGPHLTTA
ncbi:MAG: PAS domain-containing protein [Alphaproteobacteria bacterium]